MRDVTAITGLKALSYLFLAFAVGFMVVIGVYSEEPWARTTRGWVAMATPHVRSAVQTAYEDGLLPAGRWTMRNGKATAEWTGKTGAAGWKWTVETADKTVVWAKAQYRDWFAPDAPPPKKIAKAEPKPLAPVPEVKPTVKPVPSQAPQLADKSVAEKAPPQPLQLAETETEEPPLPPAVDPNPPSAGEIAKVVRHLKISLTKDLYAHFELFLYVSKAERGPWSQRMFVFKKDAGGDLSLAHSWPVSTGAETIKRNPHGRLMKRDTPPGFYQLDPKRMHKKYTSRQWQQPMPYAMFFNWENHGMKTGLAIHSAHGAEIQLIGQRASAGCVRLAPQNARILFSLIKKNYKGLAPRFAYDRRTATMSKDGLLMHDADGNLKFADGYKVLVFIENFGGEAVVAVLF